MKFALQAAVAMALAAATPAFAATAVAPAAAAASPDAAHVQAVHDLLASMQVQYLLNGVAARSHYSSEAQRNAVYAKIEKTPPEQIYQRMAVPLAKVIATDTALEMTRFYNTPYGKKVIHARYNSGPQMIIPGMKAAVPPQEQKERKRAAFVLASQKLAEAQPVIEHEAFLLLQQINKEK